MKKNKQRLPLEVIASIREGNIDIAKQYLDFVDYDGRSPVYYSILDNDVNMLRHLMSAGADLDLQDKQGWASLHFAAQFYNLDATSILLRSGASTEIRDKYGNTPLWRAVMASKGKGEVIILLLEYGANAHTKNYSRISPFGLAKEIANYDIVQFFNR